VFAQFSELLAGDEWRVNVGEGVIDGERTVLVAKLGHVITDEILDDYKKINHSKVKISEPHFPRLKKQG
jgi:hypothetical protein